MILLDPKIEVENFDGKKIMKNIERACRTCYRSEGNITEDSYKNLLKNCINRGHESVLEHEKVTVRLLTDISFYKDVTRHRLSSFSIESTRYCNYSKDKFGNELTFIIPCWLDYEEQQFTDKDDSSIRTDLSEHEYFIDLLLEAENTYNYLVQYCGCKPQQARAVLPNSLKTDLVMTGFTSDWKHFFELRDAASAHLQAQELAHPLHKAFIQRGLVK